MRRIIAVIISMIFFKSYLRCSTLLKSLESIIRVNFVMIADVLVYKPSSVGKDAVRVNFICTRMLTIPSLYIIIICCGCSFAGGIPVIAAIKFVKAET